MQCNSIINLKYSKTADHVHRIAVQCFHLLLILPLDLMVIFLKIKLLNGLVLLEVNSVIKAADCLLDCT